MRFLLLFLLLSPSLSATTFHVGSTRNYVSPNALYLANVVQNGDTIDIDAEDFAGAAALARWSAHNLLIRGVGGRPHLIANGQALQGKSIWIVAGDNNTIENIEFSGCSVPDHNGAGIRQEGIGVTVRHCYFHDNETGILTNNPGTGDILIEYCEFNANSYGDGYSHNLYIGHVNSLTFRFNYSHHAKVGHNLKSRATYNYIFYNRIMDEQTGNSSRLIDLPNGGTSVVMGNLLMQGPLAENSNLVGYGLEGLINPAPHELYFVHNTCVNKRPNSGIFVQIQNGTAVAQIVNNIFAGGGTQVSGTATQLSNNIVEPLVANLLFTDEPNYDYHLTSGSPAIDQGIALGQLGAFSLTPDSAYLHPTASENRINTGPVDAGAYEYNPPSATFELTETQHLLFPNPLGEVLYFPAEWNGLFYRLLRADGREIGIGTLENGALVLPDLSRGAYFLVVERVTGVRIFSLVK